MTDLRNQVAQVAADANQPRLHTGYLAEDYDGIGQYVAVALSRGSASAALAHVSAGAFASDQTTPAGTAVTVISKYGQLEVISLGSKTNAGTEVEADGDWTTNQNQGTATPVRTSSPIIVSSTGAISIDGSGFVGGWGAAVRSGGLYNAEFEEIPPLLNTDIHPIENLLPYWPHMERVNSTVDIQTIEDDTYGYILRVLFDGGRTAGDYAWIGQQIPASIASEVEVLCRQGWPGNSEKEVVDIVFDFYAIDGSFINRQGLGVYTSRSAYIPNEYSWLTTPVVPPPIAPTTLFSFSARPWYIPEGAHTCILWLGGRAANSESSDAYFDLIRARLVHLPERIKLADLGALDGTPEIFQRDRILWISANVFGGSGSTPTIALNGTTGKIQQSDQYCGSISITPVANTPTSATVSGLGLTGADFKAVCSARSTVPGSSVVEVSVGAPSSSGVTIYIYRTNTTKTGVDYFIKAGDA